MEASEKPQVPQHDSAPGEGMVRAIDDRLVIERLTVADERAARVVRERAAEGQPPAQTVIRAVEIGTRVLDAEGTAANVDYVRRELESGLGELDRRLGTTLETGTQALAERIAATFGADRSDSVQSQIKEIVAGATQQQREAMMRLFTAEDGSNPLLAFQSRMAKAMTESDERHRQEMTKVREGHANAERTMRQEIAALREQVALVAERHDADQRVAEAEEAGTRKGFTFEERVHEELERIAGIRGDCASHTGAEGAEGGGKKGDTLIELGAAAGPALGRVLFEAKDKKLSRNDAWAQLNQGMAARAAAFGVLVVAGDDRVPARTHQLHEYEGNKMIVALDRDEPDGFALEVAYRLAAARVAMARDRELQVDAVAVRDVAQDAISTLKQAQAIRASLTGIKTSSDRARDGLDAMVDAVRAKLERVEAIVAEAQPGAEEGVQPEDGGDAGDGPEGGPSEDGEERLELGID
jgi:hypothetical protein